MPPYQSGCLRHDSSTEASCTDLSLEKTDVDGSSTELTQDNEDRGSDTGSRTCRRVSFAEGHQVHSVLGLVDYTFLEHKGTWPSPYEMYQSKFHHDKIMSRIQRGKPCKKEMTYRGLEHWFASGPERLQEITTKVKKVVMEEQKRQRELEYNDPEALATRCASITAVCQQQALELANEDEQEVRLDMQRCPKKRWSLSLSRRRS